MTGNLPRAATYYAGLGWHVHPLNPRSKAPATEHGFEDATDDVDQVREWWQQCPTYNIGLRTGIAFDVIDVDGDLGFRTLARLVDQHGPLDAGAVAATPGKVKNGAHVGSGAHFLVAPTGLRCGPFEESIDLKASGGYIVAPPSIHPDGTGAYAWAMAPKGDTIYPPAPPWVFEPARRKEATRKAELEAREARRAERKVSTDDGEPTVMERFNATASWKELLEPGGWTYSHERGDNGYWCRPGKTTAEGHGASTNDDTFYVFTAAAERFEQGEGYSKFALYTLLNHGGDYVAATKHLADCWRAEEKLKEAKR